MERFRTYHINNSSVKIIFGNILDSKTEVIANSSGSKLTMSGGLTKDIRMAGGEEILQDAQSKLPVQVGDAIVTTAGKLSQKYIFHCITLDKSLDHSHTPNSISNDDLHQYTIEHSVNKCFQLLHTMELSSIAFPSIGAGAAGIPFKNVAKSMASVIGYNLRKTNRPIQVEIYLYDRFGKMTEWGFLPMFEEFAKQEGISRIIRRQTFDELTIEEYIWRKDTFKVPIGTTEVFISYSRKDSDTVKPIYEMLEKAGIKCWLDVEGMYSGVSYKKVIVEAIKNTSIVLFMSSINSNKSHNVVSEISLAMEYSKKVIPVRLDKTPYSESIEYDIINHDFITYEASSNEQSLEKIMKKVQTLLEIFPSNTPKGY